MTDVLPKNDPPISGGKAPDILIASVTSIVPTRGTVSAIRARPKRPDVRDWSDIVRPPAPGDDRSGSSAGLAMRAARRAVSDLRRPFRPGTIIHCGALPDQDLSLTVPGYLQCGLDLPSAEAFAVNQGDAAAFFFGLEVARDILAASNAAQDVLVVTSDSWPDHHRWEAQTLPGACAAVIGRSRGEPGPRLLSVVTRVDGDPAAAVPPAGAGSEPGDALFLSAVEVVTEALQQAGVAPGAVTALEPDLPAGFTTRLHRHLAVGSVWSPTARAMLSVDAPFVLDMFLRSALTNDPILFWAVGEGGTFGAAVIRPEANSEAAASREGRAP